LCLKNLTTVDNVQNNNNNHVCQFVLRGSRIHVTNSSFIYSLALAKRAFASCLSSHIGTPIAWQGSSEEMTVETKRNVLPWIIEFVISSSTYTLAMVAKSVRFVVTICMIVG
jgi:hypothetical protein